MKEFFVPIWITVLIIICFICVPSTEKGMAGISAIASVLAAGSLYLSEKAFEQTEKTLHDTETSQEIRDIERSLDLFYFPLRDYLDEVSLRRNNADLGNKEDNKSTIELGERALEQYNEIRKNIAPHRYLATLDTRTKFEVLRLHGYRPRNRPEKEVLSQSVDDDIREKEGKLINLKLTLTNKNTESKTPSWKFWE